MTDTKAERLADALNDFISSSPDVEAAAVVSFDGLAMASALPEGMDEDRLGAMSAALLSLGEQAANGLGRGDLSQVFVEGEHGFVFLMSAKDQAVLATITSKAAKIGFMLFEMRRAAEVIGALLEERARDPRFDEYEQAAADDPYALPLAPVAPAPPPAPAAPEHELAAGYGVPEANGHAHAPSLSSPPWA
jgi:uncharacterized protein